MDRVEYFPVLDARPHLAATQLHALQPPHQPLETIGHVEELRWNKIIDFSFMIKQSRCQLTEGSVLFPASIPLRGSLLVQ